MIEAIVTLALHLLAAVLMVVLAASFLVMGVVRSAWTLFCWPSTWFRRG